MSHPTKDAEHQPGAWYEDDATAPADGDESPGTDSDAVIGMVAGFEAGSSAPAAEASSTINPNRNLSDVIRKIRDDGPPGGDAAVAGQAAGRDEPAQPQPQPAVTEAAVVRPTTRRSLTPWLLLILLSLIIAMPAVQLLGDRPVSEMTGYQLLGTAFDRAGNFLSRWREPDAAVGIRYTPGPDPATGKQIQELQAAQAEIVQRLDELSAAVAALTAGTGSQRDNATDEPVEAPENGSTGPSGAGQAPQRAKTAQEAAEPVAAPDPVPPEAGAVDPAPADNTGGWALNLASSTSEGAIQSLQDKLQGMGFTAEQQTVTVKGQTRYRLRIPGFRTREAAREFADMHGRELRIKDPWITQQ